MDYSFIVNVVFSTLGAVWVLWRFLFKRKEEKYEKDKKEQRDYTDARAVTGKLWVDEIKDRVEKDAKYTTQKFSAITSDVVKNHEAVLEKVDLMQKNIRKIEYQQVAKETVKEMLDDRVRPLEASVEKLEGAVERGFKDVSECNQHVLLHLVRLEGKLEGSGIIKGTKDD